MFDPKSGFASGGSDGIHDSIRAAIEKRRKQAEAKSAAMSLIMDMMIDIVPEEERAVLLFVKNGDRFLNIIDRFMERHKSVIVRTAESVSNGQLEYINQANALMDDISGKVLQFMASHPPRHPTATVSNPR